MLLWWSLAAAALADPLPDVWARVAPAIGRHSPVPVVLSAGDLDQLLAGEVIARRSDTPQGVYATGALLFDASLEATWVTIQDARHDPASKVRVQWLDGAPAGAWRVYNQLDLPWPLADRQWVMELTNNRALYDATNGLVWQRTWREADPSLAPAPNPSAEWVPETRGAWTLVATDGGTLALFSLRTVLGGLVPTSVTNAWAVSTIRSSLTHLAERARGMSAHYTAAHDRVPTPSGAIIGAL